ncbi:MAG TPA: hypothetical protein PLM70_07880 [Bacteroidales bacterium]|nr:hypothetical protein [Bacteroidales bacterium]
MKKSILILSLLILMSFYAISQSGKTRIYWNKHYEEYPSLIQDYIKDSLLIVKNYSAFLKKIYSKNVDSLKPKELYWTAAYYDELNQPDSVIHYLNIFFEIAPDDRSILFYDHFPNLKKNSPYWQKVVSQIEKHFLMEIPDVENKDLALKIFYLSIDRYRSGLPYAELNVHQLDSLVKIGELSYFDAPQYNIEMDSIIELYGFPTIQMVGNFAAFQSYDILHHSRNLIKYYSEVKKAYLKNGVDPVLYAMMTDRYLLLKGKKQIYGTQFRSGGTKYNKRYPGACILSPVKNIKELNKRRLEMGMSTIEEYVEQNKNMNFVIPKEYYK